MPYSLSDADLKQNLFDAGCCEADAEKALTLLKTGKTQEGLRILAKQRVASLDGLHKSQKEIDCLDYLVYQLKKQGE